MPIDWVRADNSPGRDTTGGPISSPGRVLVLGASGMLGHKMLQVLSARYPDVWGTIRGSLAAAPWGAWDIFQSGRVLENVDALDGRKLESVLDQLQPAVTVNCIGLVKQRPDAAAVLPSLLLNAVLPHRVATCVAKWSGRVVHFGTDCVFSGDKGDYVESDSADATDLYGRSKYFGELPAENILTLRTSFVGRELTHWESLLERLLRCEGSIRGHRRAFWSGVTSLHLAEVVSTLLITQPALAGTFHLSSGRWSKYELLVMLRDRLQLDTTVIPDDSYFCDRSLVGNRFAEATGYVFPGWSVLLDGLAEDTTPYDDMEC